uniref:Uncharacterized protein n=1 Tax=Cajanus cajan TaxID=3821 RepID=A0A151U544_CAJCA|nr:hypothetical protein KK1_007095 [Cajanus cajan]
MAQYGFATYRISSAYNTSSVSSEIGEPVSKPFAPFVPKLNNGNGTSEGYVTKKKIVPVASGPYFSDEDESDDEWTKHPVRSSPPKVDEFLTKVHNEASRPSSGYGDYRSNKPNGTNYDKKEVSKPFGGAIKNDNHGDGYYNSGTNGYGGHKPTESTIRNNKHDGTNGYGDYGGRKPVESTIRNNKYDDPNGYRDYGARKPVVSAMHDKYDGTNGYGGNKEGRKPIGSALNHDGYNGYGSDYGNKEGRKPIRGALDHDDYNGYGGDYGNKEGRNPVEIPVVKKGKNDAYGGNGSPVKGTNYDGHGGYGSPFKDKIYDDHGGYGSPLKKEKSFDDHGGYGSPLKKEKSFDDHGGYGSPFKETNFDGHNGSKGYGPGGYGDYYNNSNKEGHKPPSSPMYRGYGHNKEKGKPYGSVSPTGHDDKYYDDNGYGNKQSGPKITSSWTASPRKGTQLTKPMNDIGEAIELLKIEGAKLNGLSREPKPSYENNPHQRRYDGPGNDKRAMDLVNETERLPSVRPRFNPVGGRGRERDYGSSSNGVIDHVEAQRRYKGIAI